MIRNENFVYVHLAKRDLIHFLPPYQISEEGSTISCVVERTRGALDHVYVNYTITQVDYPAELTNASDIANSTGTIHFLPGQRSEVTGLISQLVITRIFLLQKVIIRLCLWVKEYFSPYVFLIISGD